MRVTRLLVLLGVVLVTGCPALAPAYAAGLEKGTLELAPSMAYSYNDIQKKGYLEGVGTSALVLSGEIGYCLTPLLEISGGPVLMVQRSFGFGDSFSNTGLGLQGGLTLNFARSENLMPYVAAGLGFLSFSGDGVENAELELDAPIVRLGLRLMAGPAGGVDVFGEYSHISNFEGVKDILSNQFVVGVGMALFPGRK